MDVSFVPVGIAAVSASLRHLESLQKQPYNGADHFAASVGIMTGLGAIALGIGSLAHRLSPPDEPDY